MLVLSRTNVLPALQLHCSTAAWNREPCSLRALMVQDLLHHMGISTELWHTERAQQHACTIPVMTLVTSSNHQRKQSVLVELARR